MKGYNYINITVCFTLKQSKNYLNAEIKFIKMKKTTIIMLIVLVVVIGIFYINFVSKNTYKLAEEGGVQVDRVFDDYANEWIEEREDPETNKNIVIDVREATRGSADFVLGHERYVDEDGEVIVLYLEGAYEGEGFTGTYIDYMGDYSTFEPEQVKMRIWNEMNPNDGVIEGFALARKENDEFVFYLFIDEDWAKRANYGMEIIWGNDLNNNEKMRHRGFDFSREEKGIYIDKVTEDVDWFYKQDPIIGGLFFGEITFEQFKNDDFSGTFIMLT